MNDIQERFGNNICRRCINEQYGVNLEPRDCRYADRYPHHCPCCGEMRNIVGMVTFVGKLKLCNGTDPGSERPIPAGRGRHELTSAS